MKYDNIIYRPPSEANTLLLQVTSGCSHNKCSYCSMYRDIPFKTESLEQIEKDLIKAKVFHKNTKRIYFSNCKNERNNTKFIESSKHKV